MIRLIAVLMAFGFGLAQVPVPLGNPPRFKALLSNLSVDVLPAAKTIEGLRRGFPFAHLLDAQRWQACGANLRCQAAAEWVLPFSKSVVAEQLEIDSSYQWNLFDARTYWHAQARVTPQMGLCESGVQEGLLGIPHRQGPVWLSGEAFCLGANQLPPVSFEAYNCEADPPYYLDRPEIRARIGYTYREILGSHTYPQMWDALMQSVVQKAPLSLVWSQPLMRYGQWSQDLSRHALLLMVHNPSGPSNSQTLQQWSQALGAYGAAYYNFSPSTKSQSLARQTFTASLPPAEREQRLQQIYWLEGLKYKLGSTRRGVFDEPLQWANPQRAIPTEAHAAAPLWDYEYMGYATAFWLFPQRTAERTPRGGGQVVYPYIYCWEKQVVCTEAGCSETRVPKPLPPEYFAVPNYPNLNRWNTAFFAVSQGFPFKDGRQQSSPLLSLELERFSGSPNTLEGFLATSDWPQAPLWRKLLQQRLEALQNATSY